MSTFITYTNYSFTFLMPLVIFNVVIKIVRIQFLYTKHKTLEYPKENQKLAKIQSSCKLLLEVLFRDYLNFKYKVKWIGIIKHISFLIILSLVSLFINFYCTLFATVFFLLTLLIGVANYIFGATIKKDESNYNFEKIILQICHDLGFWFGFLFYYPINPKESYEEVKFNS